METIKKRGRRKKVVDNEIEIVETKTKADVSKRIKKNVKVVDAVQVMASTTSRTVNLILHLKCSVKQIDDFYHNIQTNSGNLVYQPDIPIEIKTYDKTNFEFYTNNHIPKSAYKSEHYCLKCQNEEQEGKHSDETCDDNILQCRIKELKQKLHKNDLNDKKSACFWCSYSFDNDTCYVLQNGANGNLNGLGSFCSPECSVAFLFTNMNLDDSAKLESYQLINYYYGKPNHYIQSIKPAISPFYVLDKYFGNMSIQEYRKLSKSQHMLLVVNKPVTRVLPELHEDTERFSSNTTTLRGNYKVKKNSEKSSVPNRNLILRDSFGLG